MVHSRTCRGERKSKICKIESFRRSYVYYQMIEVCAAFLAVGCITGWGMTVLLMRCPYYQCTDVYFCQS